MAKVIPQNDIYNYLYNESYTGVRGFSAVKVHSEKIKSLEENYEGARLDYNNTTFKITNGVDGISESIGSPDRYYGTIEYNLAEPNQLSIPRWDPKPDSYPYTGRGITGSKEIVLPEYYQEARKFVEGDMMFIKDSKVGEPVFNFIYDGDTKSWVEIKQGGISMGKYAKYNNKSYPVNIRNDKYRLRSKEHEDGFNELVDLGGNIHHDIFIKEVTLDEIEFLFELKYKIIYKGKEYEPFAIGELVIDDGEISLFSSDYESEGFEKQEQFVFKKEVSIDEIDALVEIMEPISIFNKLPENRKVISSIQVKEYLKSLNLM